MRARPDEVASDRGGDGDGEQSRLDREFIELLNELRVVPPGVQALFAFLLIVPFTIGSSASATSSATSISCR